MRTLLVSMALLAFMVGNAFAQSVALSGVSGSKALLTVDSSAPRFLSPGQTHQGVKLVSVDGQSATVEIDGKKQTLRVGEAPVSLGGSGTPSGGGNRIVLTADGRGHFMPQGQINGRSVQFMVDTGATVVAIGEPEARRINIAYKKGRQVMMNTANGAAIGWEVKLDSLRLGDMVSYNITAVITPQAMPFVLLGNNYLTRFQMTRTNDQMTLEKR
ncbi:peptidase A2 [Hydrogenophaga crassostreae]|uniref:Peptidase A2 n=1 Tax=Hydrogenophaga crassostreae TaxID=1763535 RepID=A0A167IA75_9BURK|nr:retropepsin-like aspartic protease [Hydrogenophaga crassostreae]AOW12368.1 peptidase A2 [Hydrogenophaga crassostreae]OAD42418.1 peptidase A2 [Hydrogenophaga crassostreae]